MHVRISLEPGDRPAQAPLESGVAAAVDADADDRQRGCAVAARLDEDAAELRAVDHEVVRPFERGARGAERAQRARRADAGDEREPGQLARRPVHEPRQREGDSRARGRMPAPPAAAATRGLSLGGEQHIRPAGGEQQVVRRGAALEHAHLDAGKRDRAGLQSVHFR